MSQLPGLYTASIVCGDHWKYRISSMRIVSPCVTMSSASSHVASCHHLEVAQGEGGGEGEGEGEGEDEGEGEA